MRASSWTESTTTSLSRLSPRRSSATALDPDARQQLRHRNRGPPSGGGPAQRRACAPRGGEGPRFARFVMAALSSVPWVGGLISATASLYSEKDQSKVNVLPITENAKRPWRALVCRCHGPAFPRNRPKRLRKSSRCWDTPSGCHGPASAAGSDVFSLGR